MELINATNLATGFTVATDKAGREWLVTVAKATYGIPAHLNQEPVLLDEQAPLVMTDVFNGDPTFSAAIVENDFALHKPRCDVLLNGSAHAPGGKPAERVTVTLQVGRLTKSFDVVGNRVWQADTLTLGISKPDPFKQMPISYNRAFGGIDRARGGESAFRWHATNPVGVGWHEFLETRFIDNAKLPNTEETGNPVRKPNGSYKPMAFGPVPRSSPPRLRWAGTYDQKWIDSKFPFLPDDFDDRYFQAAPEDQQTDYLQGGEEVVLTNLTARGRTAFCIPKLHEPFDFCYKTGDRQRVYGVVDTLVLEPDLDRFTLTLRASVALRRTHHEISVVEFGGVLPEPPDAETAPQAKKKPHYRSLSSLPKANRILVDSE